MNDDGSKLVTRPMQLVDSITINTVAPGETFQSWLRKQHSVHGTSYFNLVHYDGPHDGADPDCFTINRRGSKDPSVEFSVIGNTVIPREQSDE